MAFASDVYTGNGSTTTFALTFPYVRPEHVTVFVNFVSTAYTYTNSTTVNVSPAPGNGLRVEVRRVTPLAAPLVDFTDGSVLVAADLDTNALQNLYIEQELDDRQKASVFNDDATGLITAGGRRITAVADPTSAQDAATKIYVDTADALKVAKAGDTMSGALAMGANKVTGLGAPTASNDAATKTYVDTADALKVAKAGDTMSGPLAMGTSKVTGMGDPTSAQDAATKTYVDTADALKVAKAGDTMSGALAMGTNKITGLGTPTVSTDASTKAYVDTADALKVAKAGDSMTGALAMGTNKITGMGDPTSAQDAATKTYVDTADALKVAKAGDSMTGALAMGTNKVTGLGTPTVSTDAASKGYVDGLVAAATLADADYGDITVSGSSTVWTIDAGAVTSAKILDGTIVNADINASAAIADTKLDTIATALKVSNSATTAVSANTASAIVARDASGNFTAGTITAALTGAASSNVLKAGDTMTGVLAVTAGTAALPGVAVSGDLNTGVFSPGADQVAISTGGTSRLAVSTTAVSSTLAIDIPLGAVGTPSLTFTGDTNTGAFSPAADTLALVTAGTNRLHITSGGLVGIGTTGPTTPLSVRAVSNITTYGNVSANFSDNTTGTLYVQHSSGKVQLGSDSALAFGYGASATEGARIDSSGRLLVGTSTARANFFNSSLSASLQIEGISSSPGTDRRMAVISSTSDSNGAHIILAKQKSGALGGNTIVANADQIGSLFFLGSDGSEFVEAASILCEVDGTPGANDLPGRLVFSTTADGASTSTERMRIDSSGNLLVGTTTNVGSSRVSIARDFNINNGLGIKNTGAQGGGQYFVVFNNSSDNISGSISHSGSATVAFNTSSDYRIKENVVPLTGAVDRINQLQVRRFNFIAEPDRTFDGFIAHEVQAVVPEAITGEKDAVDVGGKPIYQGIDQSKLVPLLTAALQEAIAKIETQGASIAALEARLTALEVTP